MSFDYSASGQRSFLFLQGPHGPFFWSLAKVLRATGARAWRVGFNAGDQAFWRDAQSYVPFMDTPENWPDTFRQMIAELSVTDLVLYGDTRPVHAQAVEIAKAAGLTVHVFEEGYLRPWWVTYERDGSNGNSRLMQMSVADMEQCLDRSEQRSPPPPTHWGDMRQHIFYGALYHWFVMFLNRNYRHFRSHREVSVSQEFALYFKRLLRMPVHRLRRELATWKVNRSGFPYHLVLLQLGHDSSVQSHSGYARMSDFVQEMVTGFAEGAPRHHHLVIKEHPLENHREPLRRLVAQLARKLKIDDRVHYVPGGKLAGLLDDAQSAVTINSTAGQQVLWRGLPLRSFGQSVYDKPEFVSRQSVSEFFANPQPPDAEYYRTYRRFLLATSQVPGGFYSRRGRRQLLRRAVDMMLNEQDPYQARFTSSAAERPQLRIIG
ncbi:MULTISPECIES: capsule biosynthesis protein [unclassified Ruegeria]|uniref:capsule biosynthesis protein n=1 Tax=unclassified Ruegeria TaxID=2625375 RepID=UPI001487FB30|nr:MULTISPECIES: capsular biosynthesis protein [unclassified Ruegeria]